MLTSTIREKPTSVTSLPGRITLPLPIGSTKSLNKILDQVPIVYGEQFQAAAIEDQTKLVSRLEAVDQPRQMIVQLQAFIEGDQTTTEPNEDDAAGPDRRRRRFSPRSLSDTASESPADHTDNF